MTDLDQRNNGSAIPGCLVRPTGGRHTHTHTLCVYVSRCVCGCGVCMICIVVPFPSAQTMGPEGEGEQGGKVEGKSQSNSQYTPPAIQVSIPDSIHGRPTPGVGEGARV